jgi:hypothetical protein
MTLVSIPALLLSLNPCYGRTTMVRWDSPVCYVMIYIVLTGLALQPEHCHVTNNGSHVSITPLPDARVFVNGALIRDATTIHHDDRVSPALHSRLCRASLLVS